MSVQSEIERITNNVQATLNTIADTGVEVGTGSDALPAAAAALANEKAPIDHTHPVPSYTELPASGTELTANTEYRVSATVGTYQFAFPASGDVYVRFTTDSTYAISFASGTKFLGSAPEFAASTTYELMARDGIVAVGEVVTA